MIKFIIYIYLLVANVYSQKKISIKRPEGERNFLIHVPQNSNNNILLVFGKGMTIRLETNGLRCMMEDIGKPRWPAVTPRHKKG